MGAVGVRRRVGVGMGMGRRWAGDGAAALGVTL